MRLIEIDLPNKLEGLQNRIIKTVSAIKGNALLSVIQSFKDPLNYDRAFGGGFSESLV